MKYLPLLILIIIGFNSFSQDYIYKLDSSRIEAKVLTVEPAFVRYKLFNSSDSSVYSISKDALVLIVYENRTFDLFPVKIPHSPKRTRERGSLKFVPPQNAIDLNLFEFFIGNLGVSYERKFKNKLGVRIPVNFNTSRSPKISGFQKLWATGISLNYYPLKPSRLNFFFGPSFETGQYIKKMNFGYSNTQYNSLNDVIYNYVKFSMSSITSGLYIHLNPNINSIIYLGIPVWGNYSSWVKLGYQIGFQF